MITTRTAVALAAVWLPLHVAACSDDGGKKSARSTPAADATGKQCAAGVAIAADGSCVTGTTPGSTTKTGGTTTGPTDGGEAAGDEGGDDGDVSGGLTGEQFFDQKVAPAFKAKCGSCHAPPRVTVEVRGPLTILDYVAMKAKLADGTGGVANGLYRKVRNRIDHSGGDRCAADMTDDPACRAIYNWWKVENPGVSAGPTENAGGGDDGGTDEGGGDGPSPEGFNGAIDTVSALGVVSGWAANDNDLTQSATVTIVEGGPLGTGTTLGTTVANKVGFDAGRTGPHAFTYELAAALRNGAPRTLYAYVNDGTGMKLLAGSPFSFRAFAPTAEGRAHYDSKIRPIVNSRCLGCHPGVGYETHYGALIAPTPYSTGGTETGNTLYRKAAGQMHSGGNQCGGNTLCAEIQAWWRIEFGG